MSEFTCGRCGGTFERSRPEREAEAEAEQLWSRKELVQGIAEICDDCFEEFMAWLKAHPEEREN